MQNLFSPTKFSYYTALQENCVLTVCCKKIDRPGHASSAGNLLRHSQPVSSFPSPLL